MVFPKARAAVAGLLFVGWLGFLLFLVLRSRDPIFLSGPQFLVANVYAVADLSGDPSSPVVNVTNARIAWTQTESPGSAFAVENLSSVRAEDGWKGPGTYILPLVHTPGKVQIAAIPTAPGVPAGQLRIYPLTAQTQAQLDALIDARQVP